MPPNATNTEPTRSDMRKAASWIGALLIALPIFYILSIGPAAKLVQYHVVNLSTIRSFYAPLEWLGDQSKPMRIIIHWYVTEVWRFKP